MKTFSQFKHLELADDAGNALVKAGIELVALYSESKKKEFSTSEKETYEKANHTFTESLMKYCVESAGIKFTTLEVVKNPMVYSDPSFIRKFNGVIAQIMTPVAPALVSNEFMGVSEVKQIGFGETARFVTRPNDTFVVNDIAEGIRAGGLQRLYNNEVTVNPTPKQVRYDMPWLTKSSHLQ
jgi:hypothetical protein